MADTAALGAVRFRVSDPGDAPAGPWREADVEDRGRGVREAILTDLPASTAVQYEVNPGGSWSGVQTFQTAPPIGEARPVRVLLFGDSGWGSREQVQLAGRMDRMEWDLAMHVGDIAYNDGSEVDFTERHFKVYRRLLARVPFFPSVGNHDVRADSGTSYDRAFDWPDDGSGRRWYSFQWGDVLFVALDTSSGTEAVADLWSGKGEQHDWLQSTLEAAHRDSTVQWTVVFGHHPPYSHAVGISGHGPNRDLRRALSPLFDRYGVDLVASGHDHHYERLRAIRGGRPVSDGCGPVYMVQGAGGASRYARDVGTSEFTAFSSREFSFTELVFEGDRVRGRTIGADGGVLDEFTLRPFAGPETTACDT
jgi:3',5'-cyclic AMP phosphodiesterase CpdA